MRPRSGFEVQKQSLDSRDDSPAAQFEEGRNITQPTRRLRTSFGDNQTKVSGLRGDCRRRLQPHHVQRTLQVLNSERVRLPRNHAIHVIKSQGGDLLNNNQPWSERHMTSFWKQKPTDESWGDTIFWANDIIHINMCEDSSKGEWIYRVSAEQDYKS